MKRFLRKLLLYVIGFGIGLLILANVTSYSKGERTGHIVKLEKKGLLFKTWEGSLDMSIFQGARPNKGNVENTLWTFTVSDDKIAQQIQDEMTYPGQIKVTVIRETRSVSVAK